MVSLGTNGVKRRETLEAGGLELLGGDLAVAVLVHRLEHRVDDIIRLFLVFDIVLDVTWRGMREHEKEGVAHLGFLLGVDMVDAVNGLYFFAVPYPISVRPT